MLFVEYIKSYRQGSATLIYEDTNISVADNYIYIVDMSTLRCATTSIHIYLYCGYKLCMKKYRCMYTYIFIVD
jgi:hypothetical protein